MTRRIKQIEKRICKIKELLQSVGEMRPGSLTRQYSKSNKKSYYQISYTYKMKSRTEYVRPEFTTRLKEQIKMYKYFKKLIQEWIDLAIEQSRQKIDLEKKTRK